MSKISLFRKRRRKPCPTFGCSLEYSYGRYISMMWYVGCPLLSVDIIKVMRLVGEGGTRATAPLSHHTRPLFSSLVLDKKNSQISWFKAFRSTYNCNLSIFLRSNFESSHGTGLDSDDHQVIAYFSELKPAYHSDLSRSFQWLMELYNDHWPGSCSDHCIGCELDDADVHMMYHVDVHQLKSRESWS